MSTAAYLPGNHTRARWDARDTAVILRRFHLCERALIVAQSGWLPTIAPFEIKTGVPEYVWQQAMNADALRERVFELRFPSRLMEVGGDQPLVDCFAAAQHAPSAGALLLSMAKVYLPALQQAAREYLGLSDVIGDGPTHRFLAFSIEEKQHQIEQYQAWSESLLSTEPDSRLAAEAWVEDLKSYLEAIGGVTIDERSSDIEKSFVSDHSEPFVFREAPVRDARFRQVCYYWPDIVDESYPYGDGLMLQLRSAISHFNEVWAVETAGLLLHGLADELPWEFVRDAARWCYDESRHSQMGLERLLAWGFQHEEIPLGTYIYDSAQGQDLIYRLGMLYFFETKNIPKKRQRVAAFQSYQDQVSEHDMDFDWADETIHAHYGHQWLGKLLEVRGDKDYDQTSIREKCSELVADQVRNKTEDQVQEIRIIADSMVGKAKALADTKK